MVRGQPTTHVVLSLASLMTKKIVAVIRSMKTGKAYGPSGITSKMLKTSVETSSETKKGREKREFSTEGIIPSKWNDSYIINLFKWKRKTSTQGIYRKLKLTDRVLKVIEKTAENWWNPTCFHAWFWTTDAIFIMHQLQEKYLAKRRNIYLAFVDFEKAFGCVTKVIWWAIRAMEIPE